MIQPASINVLPQKLTNFALTRYYLIALTLISTNFLPFILYQLSHKEKEFAPSNYLVYWFLSCCVISIPLILEFSVDTVVSAIYPIYFHKILEHRFGHALLLLSLSLPVILCTIDFEDDLLFCRCLMGYCEALALTAVFGKLQVFGKNECWKTWNSLVILALYVAGRLVLTFSNSESQRDMHNATIASMVIAIVRMSTTTWFCRVHVHDLLDFWKETKSQRTINTLKFKYFVLLVILLLYMFVRMCIAIYFVVTSPSLEKRIVVQVVLHMCLAVGTTVLPGRMVKRGMVALQQEMEHKKTFIRYVSHEIRSPLSTTTLAIDYLIDQYTCNKVQSPDQVLEVLIQSKATCELATNTLNDLLMFDKIETGMLEITTSECDGWEFIKSCVTPFSLQVVLAIEFCLIHFTV